MKLLISCLFLLIFSNCRAVNDTASEMKSKEKFADKIKLSNDDNSTCSYSEYYDDSKIPRQLDFGHASCSLHKFNLVGEQKIPYRAESDYVCRAFFAIGYKSNKGAISFNVLQVENGLKEESIFQTNQISVFHSQIVERIQKLMDNFCVRSKAKLEIGQQSVNFAKDLISNLTLEKACSAAEDPKVGYRISQQASDSCRQLPNEIQVKESLGTYAITACTLYVDTVCRAK